MLRIYCGPFEFLCLGGQYYGLEHPTGPLLIPNIMEPPPYPDVMNGYPLAEIWMSDLIGSATFMMIKKLI